MFFLHQCYASKTEKQHHAINSLRSITMILSDHLSPAIKCNPSSKTTSSLTIALMIVTQTYLKSSLSLLQAMSLVQNLSLCRSRHLARCSFQLTQKENSRIDRYINSILGPFLSAANTCRSQVSNCTCWSLLSKNIAKVRACKGRPSKFC